MFESRSYDGVAVIRVYFQPNVHVELAFAQVTALVQTLLRNYPQGTFPPLIVKYDASSVPILQLGINSDTLSEQDLADFAQNFIRTDLARIEGASIPSHTVVSSAPSWWISIRRHFTHTISRQLTSLRQ